MGKAHCRITKEIAFHLTWIITKTRTRTVKGIAPPTFVAQSLLQRCINYGGQAEQVESKRSVIGISKNKAKCI